MRRRRRMALWVAAASLALVLVRPPTVAAATAAIPSDFDGDGHADLAIGVPGENSGAGAINVLYGSATGLIAAGDQSWSQDSAGVKGTSQGGLPGRGDVFGSALASGDFDADGYADLAVGVPGDKVVAGIRHGGAVNVLYGSSTGLTAAGDQLWSQVALPGQPEAADRFGWALASGDLDGDGFWDLAIGVPGDIVGGSKLGSVVTLFGGPTGLGSSSPTVLTRAMAGTASVCNGWFGASLAAGDLDADGFADLAVGATARFGCEAGGDASVFYGGPTGPTSSRAQLWSQDSPGVDDSSEPHDQFGYDLAIGDFDADGSGDLAISTFHFESVEPCQTRGCSGAISVLYGGPGGLTADASQFWYAGTLGVPVVPVDDYAWIGSILAAGDVSGDAFDDLVVGDGFQAMVLPGGPDGLTTTGAHRWGQGSPGVPGATEPEDSFGASLVIDDFGRSSHADLAIGVPDENRHRGVVDVLYGSATGLSGIGSQVWSQDSPGIRGSSEGDDLFGGSLAH